MDFLFRLAIPDSEDYGTEEKRKGKREKGRISEPQLPQALFVAQWGLVWGYEEFLFLAPSQRNASAYKPVQASPLPTILTTSTAERCSSIATVGPKQLFGCRRLHRRMLRAINGCLPCPRLDVTSTCTAC